MSVGMALDQQFKTSLIVQKIGYEVQERLCFKGYDLRSWRKGDTKADDTHRLGGWRDRRFLDPSYRTRYAGASRWVWRRIMRMLGCCRGWHDLGFGFGQ